MYSRGKSGGVGSGSGEDRALGKEVLHYPGDAGFATKLLAGVKAGKGESWARCECHDYTQGLVNLVQDRETDLAAQLASVSIEKVR